MKDTESTSQTKIHNFVFHIKTPTAQALFLLQKYYVRHIKSQFPLKPPQMEKLDIYLVTNATEKSATSPHSKLPTFSPPKLLSLLHWSSTSTKPSQTTLLLFSSGCTGFFYKPPHLALFTTTFPSFIHQCSVAPLHQLRRHLLAISSYTDKPPSSMQPMHIHLSWFSDQNKIRRHSSIEAARLTLISIPGFSPKLHSLTVLVRSPVVQPHM